MSAPKEPPDTSWITAEVAGSAEGFKETLGTLLDVVGMLAVAVGLTLGLWPHLGAWSLMLGGALLLIMSAVAAAARQPKQLPPPAAPEQPSPPPGPEHPGPLHVSGR